MNIRFLKYGWIQTFPNRIEEWKWSNGKLFLKERRLINSVLEVSN